MQVVKRLFLILCLNLAALIVICTVVKVFGGDGPAFLLIFIFGIVANLVVLPLNLLSLIWQKLRWWIIALSACWGLLVFDPFTKEACLALVFIAVNQVSFSFVVTRSSLSGENRLNKE